MFKPFTQNLKEGQIFLKMDKSWIVIEKVDKLNFIKIKNFYPLKTPLTKGMCSLHTWIRCEQYIPVERTCSEYIKRIPVSQLNSERLTQLKHNTIKK